MNAKRTFCKRFDLEPGVALNEALMENLYVVVVCILNKLPVFVVGKPGSSKTLAMSVIVSNLQGEQSRRPFWRKFPAVTLFSFQCSPMTQADGILQQFNMACNYAKHATNNRTVLLLDEVGLAEHSPDMPLKVLHGILVDPPISIVGISNW
jgi:E3 ubiquitin-protein ligase RNF213